MLSLSAAIVALLLAVAPAATRAQVPFPFHLKFSRQSQPDYKGGPVWKPGERVRAPLISDCAELLSMRVAEEVPGGVDDPLQSDVFRIAKPTFEQLDSLKEWMGLTFEGVVEVIRALPQQTDWEHIYDARIVSLEPPDILINPISDHFSDGTEVVVRGTVLNIHDREMLIQAPKRTFLINLQQDGVVIEGDRSGTIPNLSNVEYAEVGDEVQLKVFTYGGGLLGAYENGSCYLTYSGPNRKVRYASERSKVRDLLNASIQQIRRGDFVSAREQNAEFMKINVTPGEIKRSDVIWSSAPEKERPIRLFGHGRGTVESFNESFNIDADQMTPEELIALAQSWSRMQSRARIRSGHDQSVIFMLLKYLDMPADVIRQVAENAIESRLGYFKIRSAAGYIYQEKSDWAEQNNFSMSLGHLSVQPITAGSLRSLVQTLDELVQLETKGWGFSGVFLRNATDSLKTAFEQIRRKASPEAAALRSVFSSHVGNLRIAYNRLLTLRSVRRNGLLTSYGSPASSSTLPFQHTAYPSELADLYLILEMAETWK